MNISAKTHRGLVEDFYNECNGSKQALSLSDMLGGANFCENILDAGEYFFAMEQVVADAINPDGMEYIIE